ncbi:hypothetical protein ACJQWK_03272 [Exserohilum turcicum]
MNYCIRASSRPLVHYTHLSAPWCAIRSSSVAAFSECLLAYWARSLAKQPLRLNPPRTSAGYAFLTVTETSPAAHRHINDSYTSPS